MQVGIDIVELDNLSKAIQLGGVTFWQKFLVTEEIDNRDLNSLAGRFAAKEAILKTGLIGIGEWHKVKILNNEAGKPIAYWTESNTAIQNLAISISHTNTTAVAIAIMEN